MIIAMFNQCGTTMNAHPTINVRVAKTSNVKTIKTTLFPFSKTQYHHFFWFLSLYIINNFDELR